MKKTQTGSPPDENAVVRKLTWVSILGNVALTGFKLFAGVVGRSGAMVSDAIHSMSDVLTTFIAALGVKLGQRIPDREHPYGHERLECVASLVLGLVLGVTGIAVGKAGVEKILAGSYETLATPTAIALVAAVVSMGTKEAMYHYTRHHALRIHSGAFMADAWHHRSDALSSVGSLIGIGGAMLGFPVMDAVASVVICVFILKAAYDILKDALDKMLDTSCDAAFEGEVRAFVAELPEVLGVDLLRTRQFGNRVYVDLEVAMDGDKTLREAHAAAEEVHAAVEARFPGVKHVMIHVNPGDPEGAKKENNG